MRKSLLALTLAAVTLPTVPVMAQSNSNREYRQDVRDARRDYREDVRDARQERRRDWRQYRNYNYNRYESGQSAYYADRYYRDGRYYQPRRLSYNDRVYRGNDGRYYCRRSDGTTGLIIGGVAGGLIGNSLANGGNGLLGTLLGAAAGGAVGNAIDRKNVTCR